MRDLRLRKLARLLVNYSVSLKHGEKVLIEATDIPYELVAELIKEVNLVGAIPLIELKQNRIQRELLKRGNKEQMRLIGEYERYRMEKMQAYIGIRGSNNISELSDVPPKNMKLYQQYWLKPVHLELRVPKTKWVVLRYPTPAMAQQAQMSTSEFEDFYFKVCTLDYAKMGRAMNELVRIMNKTDEVVIGGTKTDLRFSIKGIPSVKCAGKENIPDGEVFTAPVRDSIQGEIQFNTPTIYQGVAFERIWLKFKEGRIVAERAPTNKERLTKILNSDEGARYTGEFSLGLNPYITKPMKDILFDEKISGSFHLTPGNCYKEAWNGNESEIHWDLVQIQTKPWGGGEIYFDGELIRKEGLFVLESLDGLNPENLK
jgi:aminopeptidase